MSSNAGGYRENIGVARKRYPDDELNHFVAAVSASLDVWERPQWALTASDLELRKVASLDAFVRIAVEWEGFRSRWHIAVINRDSSTYRADVETRFRASIKGGRFGELEPFVHLALPAQLSVARVQRLLDPLGRTSLATNGPIEPEQSFQPSTRREFCHCPRLTFYSSVPARRYGTPSFTEVQAPWMR